MVSGIAKMFVGELIETGKFRIVVLFTLFLWNPICYGIGLLNCMFCTLSKHDNQHPTVILTSMILCFSLASVSVRNQRSFFFFPPHYDTRNLLAEFVGFNKSLQDGFLDCCFLLAISLCVLQQE